MKAVVTVGLGFGDEGKGATVDHLVREFNADLVVRYCGGPQAGHNVQLPDGSRHTFSQFGSGTLAGARTFLGPRMIINPATMVPEADHLESLGVADPFARLDAHENCLVTTSYHVAMNRLRELARGDNRHGSCGLGVGETRSYWLEHGTDAPIARDLSDRATLISKLTLQRDRALLQMQDLPHLDSDLAEIIHGSSPYREVDLLQRSSDQLRVVGRMPTAEFAIFEGSQGVLLDEWLGFHPYTTWSTVTSAHAIELLNEAEVRDVTVLGIIRAYSTRHGEGPFPTWRRKMSNRITDLGNPFNEWQGAIRGGPLDLVLLEYAAMLNPIDGLVVTCLDQLGATPEVCTRYEEPIELARPRRQSEQIRNTRLVESVVPVFEPTTTERLFELLGRVAPVVGTASGPVHLDRQLDEEFEGRLRGVQPEYAWDVAADQKESEPDPHTRFEPGGCRSAQSGA